MENWLVKHAHEHIWCQPANDRRWIVKPAKLSSPEGESFGLVVQGYSIRLPVVQKWFHVFQLGGMNHRELRIPAMADRWVRVDHLINAYGVMLTIYTQLGRTFPLEYVWIRRQSNGNVILATQIVEGQADFSTDTLFMRFYNGAFRYSNEFGDTHNTLIRGQVVRSNDERFAMVEAFDKLRTGAGEPIAYINGYEIDNLTTNDIALFDYVEIVYDGLIERIVYFALNDLPSFHSELDGKRKFLLHLPKQTDTIHFINDIDVSVLQGNKGLYFHQNQSESLRQVTHNDYSLLVNQIGQMVVGNEPWQSVDDLTLRVVVRRSGMDRPLTYTANRLHELYKLSDAGIIDAMTGSNSQVPEWRASALETSAYNRIMAASYGSITNALCTQAYGYNAVAKYAADTPTLTRASEMGTVATLPPLLARNCTVYEYSEQGELLGYYNWQSDINQRYLCNDEHTAYIEAVEGQGTKQIDVQYDAKEVTLDPAYQYRFYTVTLKSGVPTDEVEDVTDTDAYTIKDNEVQWNIDMSRRMPVIWSDKNFLAYGFAQDLSDGHMKFSIDHWVDEQTYYPLPYAPETLELWLNGRYLVQGIDYYVQWPEVVVCNKTYLVKEDNWIDVRCRGVAKSLRSPKTGWVVDGLISNDGRYDVRDDKVLQIAVGGKIMPREQLSFREDTAIAVNRSANGQPYSIYDATVPLRGLVSENTYSLRDKAREQDERLENYLSAFIPTPVEIDHNPISQVHTLFSPIMNKVIEDMTNGDVALEADDTLYYISTKQFDAVMQEYLYLLSYEPALNLTDRRYVSIHPHAKSSEIELTPLQMAFIERLNDRYLRNRIIINKLIKIKG